MEVVVVVGAGLDVHKKRIVACCLDGRSSPPAVVTCTFGTFRDELERLCKWLVGRGCTHAAMESTGVYWMPVYRVLEGHSGFRRSQVQQRLAQIKIVIAATANLPFSP